ncbi:VWA domain-containing protein [Marispirochaeta sp.]|uniref:vWA domain-containing protein n=1 Tax=Marispirochaeta sp. TaxID=2038653 RepID=UPI0029C8FDB9|nr:VWA domain-containing protein [Marispirochaeta sp.]
MKRLILIAYMVLFTAAVWGQSVEITQIENRQLLVDGTLDIYFLLRNAEGEPATVPNDAEPELFVLDGGKRLPQKILSLEQEAPRRQGISFLLLVDNSGSMHDEYLGDTIRFETAKFAVEQFLQDIDNPLDKVGLSAFNTFYSPMVPVSPVSSQFETALNSMNRPIREHSYTELYRGIQEAAFDLADYRGRRAIIVLSDGENFPYTLSGNPHPMYGEEDFSHLDALDTLIDEGISLYAVHIGDTKDPQLDDIAKNSGGRSFTAKNRGNLMDVYLLIRDEIQQEYKLSFRPPYNGSDTNSVELKIEDKRAAAEYYVPHFLGEYPDSLGWFVIIPLLIAAGLISILFLYAWEKPAKGAEINLLSAGRSFSPRTRVNLTKEVTVIGAGQNADMTIAGNPAMRESHATVMFDKNSGNYTVAADVEFRVNNRLKKSHTLKSGDVLDFDGTTVVFDKPTEHKKT